MKTTLHQIKQFSPCTVGWEKLITYLGPDFHWTKEFPVSEVVKSNGIADTFWLLRRIMEPGALKGLVVEFACDCAERVLPIYESQYPDGPAPRRAIEVAREWLKNPTEENACAAVSAAVVDARAAVRAANSVAASYAAVAASAAAYTDAADVVANYAVSAARDAAAERQWQKNRLIELLEGRGMKCADCKWWKPKNTVNGYCLRYPPSVVTVGSKTEGFIITDSIYPETGRLNYCGEFSEKEKS